MSARIFCDSPLAEGTRLSLPPDAARHVQVLRLQPGDALTVFNGLGGEWAAEVTHMGRQEVDISVLAHQHTDRELPWRVTLALGMPANERMDALVEKATELGAGSFVPLQSARSVLKLSGERAERRCQHWQAVAMAAAEQSGRGVVPRVEPVQTLAAWLAGLPEAGLAATPAPASARYLLSFAADALPLRTLPGRASDSLVFLSGPEGGLDAAEEAAARRVGFLPLSLGPRVLRADTAPLAALAALAALA